MGLTRVATQNHASSSVQDRIQRSLYSSTNADHHCSLLYWVARNYGGEMALHGGNLWQEFSANLPSRSNGAALSLLKIVTACFAAADILTR
jgi:hypothetical protein